MLVKHIVALPNMHIANIYCSPGTSLSSEHELASGGGPGCTLRTVTPGPTRTLHTVTPGQSQTHLAHSDPRSVPNAPCTQ
jgi:hypothetical protein